VTYVDTPDLLTYRQHLQGRRRRYKVRTRAYLDSGGLHVRGQAQGPPRADHQGAAALPGRRPDTHQPAGAGDLCGGGGKVAVGLYRHVLVETRLPGRHGDADIALRSLGLRPVEMSKYCVAVAVLHPGIRRNPWHRTLQRYFADATQGTPGREPNPRSLGLLRGRDAGI